MFIRLCAVVASVLLTTVDAAEHPVYCSPAAIAADQANGNIYIADETGKRVLQLDLTHGVVARSIPLPECPTGLAINQAADTLFVSTQATQRSVFVIDLNRGEVKTRLPAGHTSMAPVLSADESKLYVCNRFSNDLSVINVQTGLQEACIPVIREPVAAAMSADGELLAVVNHKTDDTSELAVVACSLSLISTASNRVVQHIRLPHGSIGARDICVSASGRHAFVTHLLARNQVPATQLENGWLITNAISVIDLQDRHLVGTVILDDIGRGAANPWGITCSPDGEKLCVAVSGTHEVIVIDLAEMMARLQTPGIRLPGQNREASTENYADALGEFEVLRGLKTRIRLGGRGPRSITTVGSLLVTANYFTGALEVMDLASLKSPVRSIQLLPQPAPAGPRRGEQLFHDATVCFQSWQSCATCHPNGRSDGLNWDLTNDGIGNPKNTKSLLFADQTPPSTVTGMFDSLESCVRFELKTILFANTSDEEAAAIVSYLRTLRQVPSPYLENSQLSTSALRGQHVFQKSGCIQCHRGDHLTAMKKRDVGTHIMGDHQSRFDIPALREVWRTAPYLHHGQAKTVKDIFARFNDQDDHGRTSDLTDQGLEDLMQYLLSL